MCGGFFKTMLGLHIEFAGHLVAVVGGKTVVERLAVAADAAAYARGMGSEHCGDMRKTVGHIKEAHAGGPLVEVGYYLFHFGTHPCEYALDDHACGTCEGATFVVVAVRVKGIHAEALPHTGIKIVFRRVQRIELHKHGERATRHFPATYAHGNTVGQLRLTGPSGKGSADFREPWGGIIRGPDIGTYKNHLILAGELHRLCFSGKHGVNTAYLIADFPACFKDKVNLLLLISHQTVYLELQS